MKLIKILLTATTILSLSAPAFAQGNVIDCSEYTGNFEHDNGVYQANSEKAINTYYEEIDSLGKSATREYIQISREILDNELLQIKIQSSYCHSKKSKEI